MTDCDGPGTILVVEDHDDLRQMVQDALNGAGYESVCCASAADALSVLQTGRKICLIVLDLMMPGLSGFQFRAEQQSDPVLRDIPVVVMTGMSQPHDYHGNLRAVGYLRKPFQLEEILALVREHCGLPNSPSAPGRPTAARATPSRGSRSSAE